MTVRPWTDADTTHATWLQDAAETIAAYRADGDAAWHAAVDSAGELAGFVGIRPRFGTVGGVHLSVNPSHRGEGQLIAAAGIAAARDMGLRTLVAAAIPGRSAKAQSRWLSALGFTPRPTWQLEL